eukprot:scaffold21064_cov110-Isochrysis_galbana.AAC.1
MFNRPGPRLVSALEWLERVVGAQIEFGAQTREGGCGPAPLREQGGLLGTGAGATHWPSGGSDRWTSEVGSATETVGPGSIWRHLLGAEGFCNPGAEVGTGAAGTRPPGE